MADTWLQLSDLRIAAGDTVLVDRTDLRLDAGEVVALVGPSGAGKTLTSRALLGLVDFQPGVISGRLDIHVDGVLHQPWAQVRTGTRADLDRAFAAVRGTVIGLLPQDARAALDPMRRVDWQVRRCFPPGTAADVHALLTRAGLDDVERVSQLWPHELSGGMARRVTIAQILARNSRFVIVDEPTTGLDAIGVHALARELRRLADEMGMGLLVITHDLRVLPGLAHRVLLMDQGAIVERLATADLASARSALGQRLVAATRRIAGRRLG